MDEEKCPLLGYEIEGTIKADYKANFDLFQSFEDPKKCLDRLCVMYAYLEKSKPDKGKAIEWAKDIIEAYRNTAEISLKIMSSKLNNLNKLIDGYVDLHKYFGDKIDEKLNAYEKIKKVLDYFNNITTELKEKDITSFEEFNERLEELKCFHEEYDNTEKLQNKLEEFEQSF